MVTDLCDAARPRFAVLSFDGLEGGPGGLFRSRRFRLGFQLRNGPVDFCRRRLLHFVGDMGVDIQCRGAGDVADNGGQGLDVHPVFQGAGGECVPLWHNKDKSETPCGATGWMVCPNSFSTDFPAKSRHNEGCQKVRCTIKDKENAYYPAGALAPRPRTFTSREQTGGLYPSGRSQNPHRQTGTGQFWHLISQSRLPPLRSVSEKGARIPSCRSVFVRPAGLLPGLLTAHGSRQLASLRSVQRGRPLRRSAAIPPNAVTSLSPCWSCEAWSHADRRVRLEAKRSVRGLGESQQAHGGIESDIPMPCLPASFYLSGSRC